MRLIDPQDNERLSALVAGGAISRETLEKTVGDRAVLLIEALVDNAQHFPSDPWLEYGIRRGLGRLHNTKASPAFIRDLALTADDIERLLHAWTFPFGRNAYGQMMVATMPIENDLKTIQKITGDNPLKFIATLAEFSALRGTYSSER